MGAWVKTYLIWWIASNFAVIAWLVTAHAFDVGTYSRGYWAGTIATLGMVFAYWRAAVAKADHDMARQLGDEWS